MRHGTVKAVALFAVLALWGMVWWQSAVEAQISSGTVNAKQTGTWTVQPGNTANTTAWKVDGTGGSFPIPANSSVNVNQVGGTAVATGNGVTGAGSQRVTIASDNTAFGVNASQTGTWTVQPGNTPNTTAWLVTQGGNGTFLAGQQAVTATAAALATNTSKGICVKALSANTINVYVGASGVTTSTGDELTPGDGRCYPLNNTNLVFVIASTTGASVSWSAWN